MPQGVSGPNTGSWGRRVFKAAALAAVAASGLKVGASTTTTGTTAGLQNCYPPFPVMDPTQACQVDQATADFIGAAAYKQSDCETELDQMNRVLKGHNATAENIANVLNVAGTDLIACERQLLLDKSALITATQLADAAKANATAERARANTAKKATTAANERADNAEKKAQNTTIVAVISSLGSFILGVVATLGIINRSNADAGAEDDQAVLVAIDPNGADLTVETSA